jgi:hypothetical protein
MTKMVHIQPPEKNTPPLNMEYFHNLEAESANDESLAEGNYKLQYRMSDTASKAPGLVWKRTRMSLHARRLS